MDAEAYKLIYSCEGGNCGIRIFLQLPNDPTALSDEMLNFGKETRHLGDDLYRKLQMALKRADPDEKAACEEEGKKLLALFGDEKIFAESTPNEYSPYSMRPWFIVTTKIGRVKIGWRKRVIVLDWSDSVKKDRAVDLFPKEDVTMDTHMIHAWGYEKAREYLKVLLG